MEQIKVSLLVPAFNTEDYVSDCLRSLVSQTLREIEVIVVDDGSTDGTGRIADQYAASDSRVRVFHQTHQGVSQSRNTCLALARGQYVGFVDSDDWVSVDAFEQLWATAEKHSADIVLGSILYDYGDGRTCRMGDKGEVFPLGTEVLDGKTCFVELMKKGCYVPMVCGNLYRRAFIHAHPLLHFEGIFHEDEYFSPYALFYARRVVDFKPDFYFYRQHAHSIMHSDNLKQRATSLWYIGDRLKQFVADQIPFKGTGDVRTAYLKLAEMLCQRAQPLYEKEVYTSNRKCLLIFSETSTAAQYGIGTYIRQLAQCFDPADWDVNVVTLHTFGREVQWEMEENVAYYEIPIPVELQSNWSSENEQLYSRSVFYYMTTRLSLSKTIYCHFNFVSHYDLALLFKERVHATVLFTMHCSDWSLDLLGDKEWLLRILANPKGRKDERIVRKFELEKKFIMDCLDRVIAIARHSYEMLRDLYGIPESRLIYIPNGIKDDYRKRSAEECRALREKYADARRTEIQHVSGEVDIEDLIPVEDCVFTLTHAGYIKRLPKDTYQAQKRGGRGISGMTRKEEDFVETMFIGSTHDYILFVTDQGRIYRLKGYQIYEGSRTSKGTNIVNLLELQNGEKVTTMLRLAQDQQEGYLTMVTAGGYIKRTPLNQYANIRKSGLIAINLEENDSLAWTRITTGENQLLVATRNGQAIRFYESDARSMGRTARGVRCVRLMGDDKVVGVGLLREGATVFTVTEQGKGRRTNIEDYRMQRRGGKGIRNYAKGTVAGIKVLDDTDDIILISMDGVIIRMHAADINVQSRYGSGVRVMRLGETDKVVTVARTEHDDTEELAKPEQEEMEELTLEEIAVLEAEDAASDNEPVEDEPEEQE